MNYVQLLEQIKVEVTRFFNLHENPPLHYHNLNHTKNVVASAGEIGRHYQLNDHDFFAVVAAAWFHDTGYYLSGPINHEIVSAEFAGKFLKSVHVDTPTIEEIQECILATKMPQSPKTLLEEILCDADLYHFGTDEFLENNKQVKKEMEIRAGQKISKDTWRQNTIRLLEEHQYKTEYARGLLEEKKQAILASLKHKAAEKEAEHVMDEIKKEKPAHEKKATVEAPESASKKAKETNRPGRGVETMFRISSNNHQRLSDMADNKAHIMITTTSIIVSVLLSLLLRKLEDNPHLIFPTILLLVVCVVTMVFSILATRPFVPNGKFTQQDVDEKTVNLLFFGNFYRMNYEEYNAGMLKVISDSEFLYGSLTRDLYSQGVVLGRKYRLLRKAYNIFMFGIVISVIAFTLAVTVFK